VVYWFGTGIMERSLLRNEENDVSVVTVPCSDGCEGC
jgi:hypothetical protein